MWCWGGIEIFSRRGRVRNEVFQRVVEETNIQHAIKRIKFYWVGHVLRRDCLLKHIIERKRKRGTEVTGAQGRRRKHLLDDLYETRRCWKFKQEARSCTFWRTRLGSGYLMIQYNPLDQLWCCWGSEGWNGRSSAVKRDRCIYIMSHYRHLSGSDSTQKYAVGFRRRYTVLTFLGKLPQWKLHILTCLSPHDMSGLRVADDPKLYGHAATVYVMAMRN